VSNPPPGLTATGGESPALEDALRAGRARVNAALARVLDDVLESAPDAVARPIRYAVDAGGKRLRPVLCVAAYEAVGGTWPGPAAELACALELVHTYSLIHDDLPCMDNDDLRRGRPTTHRVFGVDAAVVAGTALIPVAAAAALRGARALRLDDAAAAAIVRALCAAAGGGGMVGGQWFDLCAEGRAVSVAELESIHTAKTGALLAVSPRIGGMAAGAPAAAVDALEAYGRHLGLAFQIADDVLDVVGTQDVLGKNAGRDQALGKATYAALLGLDGARRRALEEADAAVAVLRAADIRAPTLEALARYAAERDR
jgi:geranylgeranyl pyrophosphate synthase